MEHAGLSYAGAGLLAKVKFIPTDVRGAICDALERERHKLRLRGERPPKVTTADVDYLAALYVLRRNFRRCGLEATAREQAWALHRALGHVVTVRSIVTRRSRLCDVRDVRGAELVTEGRRIGEHRRGPRRSCTGRGWIRKFNTRSGCRRGPLREQLGPKAMHAIDAARLASSAKLQEPKLTSIEALKYKEQSITTTIEGVGKGPDPPPKRPPAPQPEAVIGFRPTLTAPATGRAVLETASRNRLHASMHRAVRLAGNADGFVCPICPPRRS